MIPNRDDKEWSGEQRLTVTSYNGTKRDYKVKILKEDVVLGDNVFLQTDEEVDVFAKKKNQYHKR